MSEERRGLRRLFELRTGHTGGSDRPRLHPRRNAERRFGFGHDNLSDDLAQTRAHGVQRQDGEEGEEEEEERPAEDRAFAAGGSQSHCWKERLLEGLVVLMNNSLVTRGQGFDWIEMESSGVRCLTESSHSHMRERFEADGR